MVECWFDGACEPKNPGGVCTWGFLVKVGKVIAHEHCGIAGTPYDITSTNNLSEYTSLIELLEYLLFEGLQEEPIKIYGDSQLVINQVNGFWNTNSENLKPLYLKARTLINKFNSLDISWVKRDKNQEADLLTRKAYQAYTGEEIKEKSDYNTASESQLLLMKKLKIDFKEGITKKDASKLISTKLEKK